MFLYRHKNRLGSGTVANGFEIVITAKFSKLLENIGKLACSLLLILDAFATAALDDHRHTRNYHIFKRTDSNVYINFRICYLRRFSSGRGSWRMTRDSNPQTAFAVTSLAGKLPTIRISHLRDISMAAPRRVGLLFPG